MLYGLCGLLESNWNQNIKTDIYVDYSKYNTVDEMIQEGLIKDPAPKKEAPKSPIKNIIVFTNDKSDKNKTLENIRDAIKGTDIKLYSFIAAKIDADEDENKITISDPDSEMTISGESNIDTLIFSRLGVQDEDNCEHAVNLLQDRGFLVLNPVKYSALACDKYQTALLLKKGEIPQPRFCMMTKNILYDEELYKGAMQDIYEEFKLGSDKNADLDIVVKILDGHGGTGVFMSDCKHVYAILQAIFAIDPERKLIIQRKEDGAGGDIRVHVLTLRTKQVILAAMKRDQIGSDFRSNVSLGAVAEPVTLTKEQEEIALKTASISHLPWCAVDIMPLKDKNIDGLENVVLEINASPGTKGISDVIKKNFITLLLENLNDPTEFMLQDKQAGYVETCAIDFGNISKSFLAKLDTGNSTAASTLEVGDYKETGDSISFKIDDKKLTFKKDGDISAIAGENVYKRPCIVVPVLTVGLRKMINARVALVKSRANKSTNILLNRDVLSKLGYVVNPNKTHILTKEIERVKIV